MAILMAAPKLAQIGFKLNVVGHSDFLLYSDRIPTGIGSDWANQRVSCILFSMLELHLRKTAIANAIFHLTLLAIRSGRPFMWEAHTRSRKPEWPEIFKSSNRWAIPLSHKSEAM